MSESSHPGKRRLKSAAARIGSQDWLPHNLCRIPSPGKPCGIDPSAVVALASFGCYQQGNSVLAPPALGTFGTMGRNIFRGPGLYNWDLSIVKNWQIREGLRAQLRGEFFNVLNHPALSSPYGVNGTFFQVDPSVPGSFGCACATPDVAEANPVIGTGGPRNIQLGLKFVFKTEQTTCKDWNRETAAARRPRRRSGSGTGVPRGPGGPPHQTSPACLPKPVIGYDGMGTPLSP